MFGDPMMLMLLVLLGGMLVFTIFNGRRQAKKRQEQEQERQTKMLPGARVMSRAGLFGTLVEFDADDLTKPAKVEVAPGVIVELHAQSVDLVPEETEPSESPDPGEDDADIDASDSRNEGRYTLNGEDVDGRLGDDNK